VPIGIALMLGAFTFLHDSERLRGRFDVLGALLSVAGMVSTVYGFIHVAHSGWGNTETFVVFAAAVILLVGFVVYEAFIVAEPMMPMRIFENRNRAGAYLVMFVVGAAMFGMFYFVTFFVQGVKDYSALKTGISFLPVAFTIGIVSQVVAKLMGRVGVKPSMILGTVLITLSLLWFSTVDAHSSYAGKLLPGMLVLAIAMGNLFVPLTSAAVSGVANTDAGLASALLNVGQQIGGALGLSVMTTVFGTASRNWASDHFGRLVGALKDPAAHLSPATQGAIMHRLQEAGSSGLQKPDIQKFVHSLPPDQQAAAGKFFAGPYQGFGHDLLAHASGRGFLMGAVFGGVAILAAVLLINVKKSELPSDPAAAAAVH
jgi:predicted MFS family arabinose efflux permease